MSFCFCDTRRRREAGTANVWGQEGDGLIADKRLINCRKKRHRLMAKRRIKAALGRERIVTENSDAARELYNQSRFGSMLENGRVQLSLLEGLYLLEAGKLSVKDASGKKMDFNAFLKKAQKVEPKFHIRYLVFKDMRSRGYIVKTALKFGADFRVYDRGIKPGEDHAKWVV